MCSGRACCCPVSTHLPFVDVSSTPCRKVYDETGDEARCLESSPALLLFVLTASTSVQGDLSGEQFDRLYRYYREVFAKARV